VTTERTFGVALVAARSGPVGPRRLLARAAFLLLGALPLASPAATPAASDDPQAAASGADAPLSFGPRTSWFAVKSRDPQAVASALGLTALVARNWATGLAAATARAGSAGEPSVFLASPIDGWILVVSSSLPYPDHRPRRSEAEARIDQRFDDAFTALAARFDEVQFFASNRVQGFSAWARARHARIERIFAYADGEVLANVGRQSIEEAALRFPDITGLGLDAARNALLAAAALRERDEEQRLADGPDRRPADAALHAHGSAPIPDEDEVFTLAGAWSVNPFILEGRGLPAGTGLGAVLPAELRQ
jgi:hypothetical protein